MFTKDAYDRSRVDKMRAANITHGMCPAGKMPRTYVSWGKMRQRCNNPNDDRYHQYGGRGITICDRWNDYAIFYSDMGERPEGMTLDRIDINGNYEPANCRWATPKTQMNNRNVSIRVPYMGADYTVEALALHLGMNHKTLRERLRRGWTVERATSTSVVSRNQSYREKL